MNDLIFNAMMAVITAGVGWVVWEIVGWLKEEGILAQLEAKQMHVTIVVKAMEQLYKEADGAAKLAEAKRQLVALFNSKKIPVTEAELNLLIEAAVKGLKEGISRKEEQSDV